jgi:hypothetical protein
MSYSQIRAEGMGKHRTHCRNPCRFCTNSPKKATVVSPVPLQKFTNFLRPSVPRTANYLRPKIVVVMINVIIIDFSTST